MKTGTAEERMRSLRVTTLTCAILWTLAGIANITALVADHNPNWLFAIASVFAVGNSGFWWWMVFEARALRMNNK